MFETVFRGLAWNSVGLVLVAVTPSAKAQQDGLEVVVVTAQRREERSVDVPISLTNIDRDALRERNVEELSEIAKLTPALRFDYQAGFAQPTIRGVGTPIVGSGTGSNVAIYIDGYYSPNPLAADFQLLNVESVQVLKGPQGTLFGRNATGGAILLSTSEPSKNPQAIVEASYGSYDAQRLQAYGTIGLGERVAVDLAALYRNGDGFVRDIVSGSRSGGYENWSARTGIKVELTDNVSALLRYSHSEMDDRTTGALNTFVQDGVPLVPIFGNRPGQFATERRQVASDLDRFFTFDGDSVQLTVAADLGFANLTSYSQYRDEIGRNQLDADYTAVPGIGTRFTTTDKILTQEFLLSSTGDERLQWTTGAFYFDQKNTFPSADITAFGSPFTLFSGSHTRVQTSAAFADVTYEVIDNLFLTGGLRYSHDTLKDGYYLLGPAVTLTPATVRVSVPNLKDDRVTPRVVVRYTPTESSSIYASYAQGFKSAFVNVGGQTSDVVDPEEISAYEIGYKYGGNSLSADVSAYYYDYKDLQVSSYDGQRSLVSNAANSRVYGVEGQVNYRFAKAFQVWAGAAYLDAKYERFLESPSFCLPCALDPNVGVFVNTVSDASGFQMQRSPKFTGNIGLRYSTSLAGGEFGLSGSLSHSSSFFFDTSEQFEQGSYEVVGVRAEWTDPSDRYTVAVFGDNVTDEKYRASANYGTFGIGAMWATPATIGLSVRARL